MSLIISFTAYFQLDLMAVCKTINIRLAIIQSEIEKRFLISKRLAMLCLSHLEVPPPQS